MNSSLVTQYGFNKDREGIHIVDLLSQLSLYLYLPVLNSAQSSGITIGNSTYKIFKQNIPSWSSRMDRQLDEQDSAEKLNIWIMVFDNNFIFRLRISSELCF